MDYIKQVLELEDKFRVIAIVVLALAVLGLSLGSMIATANDAHTHSSSDMQHMNMSM